jgi:hypothetical protein
MLLNPQFYCLLRRIWTVMYISHFTVQTNTTHHRVWKRNAQYGVAVGVLLAADRQSTGSSGYRAYLWDPWPDLYFSSFLDCQLLFLFSMASSLTRGRIYSLQCLHSLFRPLTTSNHILLSHPRMFSLPVASYDSQGLRWRYSNPPPHRVAQYNVLKPLI